MKRTTMRGATLAVLIVAVACAKKQEAPPPVAAAPEPAKPVMEESADRRLRAMSATLAGAKSLSFSTAERHERVNAKGVKGARESTRDFVVVRPNRFHAKRVRDGETAQAVYDGAKLSLQSDKDKVWAQVDMPPTLDEAFDYAAEVYRFPMPVADLLYSDPYGSLVADDTAARIAGKEDVNGVSCEKVAVVTPLVEADVWIEEGERALPCKLEILYKELPQTPRSSITFSNWNLAPTVDESIFTYSPPKGYNLIPMVGVLSPEEEKLVRERAKAQPQADGSAPPTPGT
jgi:hypothetical protein